MDRDRTGDKLSRASKELIEKDQKAAWKGEPGSLLCRGKEFLKEKSYREREVKDMFLRRRSDFSPNDLKCDVRRKSIVFFLALFWEGKLGKKEEHPLSKRSY